jgi:hypothetical protein
MIRFGAPLPQSGTPSNPSLWNGRTDLLGSLTTAANPIPNKPTESKTDSEWVENLFKTVITPVFTG